MRDHEQSEDKRQEAGTRQSPKSAKASQKAAEAPTAKKKISLAALSEGMPGLTPACGQTLAEAAAVCLESRNHKTGVLFPRTGLMSDDLHAEWSPVDDQSRRCHADMQEATERGACGVAILVVKEVTGKVVVERSKKGTGFDYWLGDKDYDGLPFAGSARLEVSGILFGTKAQIDARMIQKKAQIKPTDHLAHGFVAVVEFTTPVAHVESK